MYEKFTCFAVKNLDFYNDKNEHIVGRNIFLGQPTSEKGWHGMSCEKFHVPATSPAYNRYIPESGETVTVEFNRYGKIQSISPCTE